MILEDLDQLFHDFLIGGLHDLAAAFNIGGRPEQRAAAVAIVEMLPREISVYDPLCVRLCDRSRPALLLPRCGRVLTKELPDGRRIQFILAAEVPIEAAAREAGIGHDLVDRNAGIAVAVEQSPGAFKDFLARGALMLR